MSKDLSRDSRETLEGASSSTAVPRMSTQPVLPPPPFSSRDFALTCTLDAARVVLAIFFVLLVVVTVELFLQYRCSSIRWKPDNKKNEKIRYKTEANISFYDDNA